MKQYAVFRGSDCIDSDFNALWMLPECSLSVLWVLSECSLIALWLIKIKIDCSWQTCAGQTDWHTDTRTHGHTKWLLELLSEPKNTRLCSEAHYSGLELELGHVDVAIVLNSLASCLSFEHKKSIILYIHVWKLYFGANLKWTSPSMAWLWDSWDPLLGPLLRP